MSNNQIGPWVPVGSVIAFAGNVSPLQPQEGWLPCDGRELSPINNKELFDAIGYASGGNGSTLFKVPDYKGYFLRGDDQGANRDPNTNQRYGAPKVGNPGDLPGSLQGFASALPASNNFTVTIPHLPQQSKNVLEDELADSVARWSPSTQTFAFAGGGKETRPINNYVHFLIKHSDKTESGTNVIVPVGSVVPIAGQNTGSLGNQWLLCDGTPLNANQYPQLFAVIRHIHGGGSETFYLPDYRGYFLRGVSPESPDAPDADQRLPPQPTLPPGQQGASGANVGSMQYGDTGQPNSKFTVQVAHLPTTRIKVGNVAGNTNARWEGVAKQVTGPAPGTGGTESRPINAYVDWYIKASQTAS